MQNPAFSGQKPVGGTSTMMLWESGTGTTQTGTGTHWKWMTGTGVKVVPVPLLPTALFLHILHR